MPNETKTVLEQDLLSYENVYQFWKVFRTDLKNKSSKSVKQNSLKYLKNSAKEM